MRKRRRRFLIDFVFVFSPLFNTAVQPENRILADIKAKEAAKDWTDINIMILTKKKRENSGQE
jgi:hypothetical protein